MRRPVSILAYLIACRFASVAVKVYCQNGSPSRRAGVGRHEPLVLPSPEQRQPVTVQPHAASHLNNRVAIRVTAAAKASRMPIGNNAEPAP